MNCVAHQSPGLWTHPRDRADRYNTLHYWVELAKLLERGKFDALFLADVLGVYDVYRGSPEGSYYPGSPVANHSDAARTAPLKATGKVRRQSKLSVSRRGLMTPDAVVCSATVRGRTKLNTLLPKFELPRLAWVDYFGITCGMLTTSNLSQRVHENHRSSRCPSIDSVPFSSTSTRYLSIVKYGGVFWLSLMRLTVIRKVFLLLISIRTF
jgi:hypothetical protein